MAYETLSKVYYKNRAGYEQEYQARLHSVSATAIDCMIGENPAFYMQTPEMSSLLFQIMALDKRVSILRVNLPGAAIKQYYVKSLIEEVHQSLSIEQVYSTRKEIAETYKRKKEDRLLGMIQKYDALFSQEEIPLKTCRDIRRLYDTICLPDVMRENKSNIPDGECFRKQPVHIFSQSDQRIHTGLYPESAIIAAMDKALLLLQNESINLLYRIAIFHYLFGYIHPYYDGNGRLARFISSYLLSRNFDPLIGVRLSYTINTEKPQYYSMFKETNSAKNKGDLTPFILGFLDILKTSYTRLADALESRKQRLKAYKKSLARLLTEPKQKKIAYLLLQVSLFASEGLTLSDVVKFSEVGYPTVKDFLDSEQGQTMFPFTRDGRRKLYTLNLDWLDKQDI